jgi:ABC-type nitrate/sulfonate/bicarbonate transport system substrate-binding protein
VFAGPVAAQKQDCTGLKKVKITVARNSVFILYSYGGRSAGIFKKHGICLIIDPRPFKGHMAGLPAGEVPVTTYAGTAAIARINKGLDWVVIGGGLTVMQEVFVRKDSPFKTITDLRGKRFASWSTGAGAFKATRAAIIDGYGMDVMKDTKFVQASPPALLKMLERGQIDSMFNISSLTIAAAAQPDKFRSIFAPNDYWKKKTGQPIVWSGPIVAWRKWVDADPARAKNFIKAMEESFKWLRTPKNVDYAVSKWGKLAGVKNKAQAEVYKSWFQKKKVFLAKWDKETRDKQWEFLEMAKRVGVLKKIPNKNKVGLILN